MEDIIREIVSRGWRVTFQYLHPAHPDAEPAIQIVIISQELPAARCPDKSRVVCHRQISKTEYETPDVLATNLRAAFAELDREFKSLPRVDAYGQPLNAETL